MPSMCFKLCDAIFLCNIQPFSKRTLSILFKFFFLALLFILHYFAYDITAINDKTHNHSRLLLFMCAKNSQHCIASMHFYCLCIKIHNFRFRRKRSKKKTFSLIFFRFQVYLFTTRGEGVRATHYHNTIFFCFEKCHE